MLNEQQRRYFSNKNKNFHSSLYPAEDKQSLRSYFSVSIRCKWKHVLCKHAKASSCLRRRNWDESSWGFESWESGDCWRVRFVEFDKSKFDVCATSMLIPFHLLSIPKRRILLLLDIKSFLLLTIWFSGFIWSTKSSQISTKCSFLKPSHSKQFFGWRHPQWGFPFAHFSLVNTEHFVVLELMRFV